MYKRIGGGIALNVQFGRSHAIPLGVDMLQSFLMQAGHILEWVSKAGGWVAESGEL